jgi:ribonuclease D
LVLGIDTEFQRTNTFYPVPGLYQVVDGADVYLIDPLTIDRWEPLVAVLEDPAVTLIMHACGEDLELMLHHLGAVPEGIFDTQLAHAFVSRDFALSYSNLVLTHIGCDLSQAQTRSNWLKRPLSEAQIHYACEDVEHLPELHERLTDRLEALGRKTWFEETMALHGRYSPSDPDLYYRNIRKAWRLAGKDLAVLRQLTSWRERTAMAEDVPRNRVVWDDHLLAFARRPDLSEDHVWDLLPKPVARRYAKAIVVEHRQGRDAAPAPALEPPLTQSQGEVSRKLRDVARAKADAEAMSQELLARKRDVERCIRHYAETGDLSDDYRGWREPLVGDRFRDILGRLR